MYDQLGWKSDNRQLLMKIVPPSIAFHAVRYGFRIPMDVLPEQEYPLGSGIYLYEQFKDALIGNRQAINQNFYILLIDVTTSDILG